MYAWKLENNQVGITDTATGQLVRWLPLPPNADPSQIQLSGDQILVPDGNGRRDVIQLPSGQKVGNV